MAFAVEVDDFSSGLNVGQRLSRQDPRTWTGRDVLVTEGGLLVPRRKAAVGTGNATGNEQITGDEEVSDAICSPKLSSGSLIGHHMVYAVNNLTAGTYTGYLFTDNGDGTFTYVRSYTLGAEINNRFVPSRTSAGVEYAMWLRSFIGGTTFEHINLTAGGISTFTLPENGNPRTLAIWGLRLVIASTANPGRILYSDANSWGSWPAGNYLSISSSAEAITEIVPTASALYLGRESGWYVVTGTPVDMNALSIRPLEAGDGTPQIPGAGALNVGGRILYTGARSDVFLREKLSVTTRDLGYNIEGDESEDFRRRQPLFPGLGVTSWRRLERLIGGGVVIDEGTPLIDATSDGDGTAEMIVWRDGTFQRHLLDSTVDGIGGAVAIANGAPGLDPLSALRGFAMRASDNRMAPWMLPLEETRPVYWGSTAVEGLWRSAPLAGPKPAEPFRVKQVLVEVYKFKTSSETDSNGWGGSCSVKCKVFADYVADVSVGNLATPTTTELTWSQTASSIPDDWQREMLVFNCADLPAVYRVVIQLKIKMVAVRRVILVGDHIGLRVA